jgi:hypothetical protein
MTFKFALVWSVCVISAYFPSETKTLAFVQNGRNYHSCDQSTSNEEKNLRIKRFDSPVRKFSWLANTNQAEDAEQDLFDYFDPLLSPHAYPSGISPDQKSPFISNDEIQEQRQRGPQQQEDGGSKGQFGFRLSNTEQIVEEKSAPSTKGELGFKVRADPPPTTASATEETVDEKEEDLFDYFDPLRSPHDYPDGIKPNKEMISSVPAPSALEIVGSSGTTSSNNERKKKKVGVLLMDHGSKKEKSNARLQTMAKLYQMTLGTDEDEDDGNTPTIIVRAAHMEIALPSIPDGLREFKDLGVDEIICHPFFLSADGRHVKEDIPEIIGNAIEDLWGKKPGATPIPIVTTAPVGSNTQLMLGAIHSLVRENSQYLKTTLENES